MPRVALCADDYGYRPGVSAAIRRLAVESRLTATSALVTFPDWGRAAADVTALRATIDVGLHLDLVEGPPLGPMPRLAPAGVPPSIGTLIRRALMGAIDQVEIRDETLRQIEAFERATGHLPDFLDGHQHAHALPGVGVAVLAALERADPARRIAVRDPADRLAHILRRRVGMSKALTIAALTSTFAPLLRESGRPHNVGFSGVYDFAPNTNLDRAFRQFVVAPGARHLIMCHPGDGEDATDPIGRARTREADYFASARFHATCAEVGVELVRFTALAA